MASVLGNEMKAKMDPTSEGMDESVMHWDSWGAMIVYTFCTIAFYSWVLPSWEDRTLSRKSEMIQTLSAMYQPVFGDLAQNIFLFGAFAVLFSTFYAAIAAQGRLGSWRQGNGNRADMNESARQRGLKWTGVILPLLSVLCYLFYSSPVVLVLIAGTLQAIMLPVIGFAVLYFRYKKCDDKRLLPVKLWTFPLAFLRRFPRGRNLPNLRQAIPMKTSRRSIIKSVAATSSMAAGIANPSPSRAQVPRKRQTSGSASRTDASSSPSWAGPSIQCQLLNWPSYARKSGLQPWREFPASIIHSSKNSEWTYPWSEAMASKMVRSTRRITRNALQS